MEEVDERVHCCLNVFFASNLPGTALKSSCMGCKITLQHHALCDPPCAPMVRLCSGCLLEGNGSWDGAMTSVARTRIYNWMATVTLTAAATQLNSYIRNNGKGDIPEAAVTEIHRGDDEFKCLLLLQLLISHRAKSKFTVISPTREND